MRLETITLRNYRLHGALTVELDPARTLIGGPNECGKSTLIEAAHRALFLRAKTGGEMQREMISRRHSGHPEVEICFAARGRRYRLLKRFSGANGTAMLTELGGATWNGDEAESRLEELLGAEVVGGHGARRVREQWAHLWIWQGCASEDPTAHANVQCGALLARLQHEGGAAAVQSERDAQVAGEFAGQHGATFKDNGAPRAGSPLAAAMAEEREAESAAAAAADALARLERSIADFRAAEEAARAAGDALASLQPEQTGLEAKIARVSALRNDEKLQLPAVAAAVEKHAHLAQAHAQLGELRARLDTAARQLGPAETEAERLAALEAEQRRADAEAAEHWRRAAAAVREVRLRGELAAAHVQRIERTQQRDRLARQREQVQALREKLRGHEADLARTPAITPSKLKTLARIESEGDQAAAALEAMAAGVELLAADGPVRVGERLLSVGDAHILTDDTDVAIGEATRLRIRPGGGRSLSEARQHVELLRDKLRRELDALALLSVAEAHEAATRRQQCEAAIAATQAQLETLGADTIEADFAAADAARLEAEAEAGRRASLIERAVAPRSLEEAQASATACTHELREAEAAEATTSALREAAAKLSRETSERLAEGRRTLEAHKRDAAALDAQLRLLLETHGADDARAARLVGLAAAKTEAEEQLRAIREALRGLQPELLERDAARLQRAIAQHTAVRTAAEERRAIAQGELRREGASDPHAELALAEGRLQAARSHRERLEQRARAVALLHELFVEEQKSLAAQFTRPLAEKITGYLECLFGPGARAAVTLEADRFSGLRLIRAEDSAFDFEQLSGGTREQLAAAVRLAIAEVLADSHEGCLPLVFDDAFAYSDPGRVKALQRMLDLAAARGLQVIVLTCTPADYAMLGAKPIDLAR